MNQNLFVIGDVHGCLPKLEELLKHWNPDNQQLVLLGDLIDKGEDSLGVILKAMKLKEDFGAVIIGGNHEKMFVDFLRDPNNKPQHYYSSGGRETIRSLYSGQDYASKYLPETVAKLIEDNFKEEVKFVRSLPDYWEAGDYLFVHAGVDFSKNNWRDTTRTQFRWIRDPFHKGLNQTGKTIVFGHTPTYILHKDRDNCGIWISSCQTKIGVDGGAVEGGLLLGLAISENGYEVYKV